MTSRKRAFSQLAAPDRTALDTIVDWMRPFVLEAHVVDHATYLPLIKGICVSQHTARKIVAVSRDVMLDPKGLVLFKNESSEAKQMRQASVRRLAERRSPFKLSEELLEILSPAAQATCVTIATHMRQHFDMPDIKTTNFVITPAGPDTYQIQTKGLMHVLISDAVDLDTALEIYKPEITYW
jgi:hypothetical protein